MTLVIWCSAFRMVPVMTPPSDDAPEKVTKSLSRAPWFVSETVMTADPLVAAKVTAPAGVVSRIGVMSFRPPPRMT